MMGPDGESEGGAGGAGGSDAEAIRDLLNKYLIPYPRCGAEVGKGWLPILDDLFRDLLELGWDRDCAQIKEKFGYLNIYIAYEAESRVHHRVRLAEQLSKITCEFCGKPGKARPGPWVKTLCEQCNRDYERVDR